MKRYLCLILSFLILISSVHFVYASEYISVESEEKYVYRNNTYQFSVMDTDPMNISDEEFFGKYDKNGNEVIPSYFKYDEFPEMSNVKAAAMAGDYDAAKEALYEYYLPKKYDLVKSTSSSPAVDSLLHAEMQARNVYSAVNTGLPLQITDFVGQEWTDVTVDSSILLNYVKSITTADSYEVGFVIASVDKSNTPAEIKSRDTDSPPTLSLVVNNVQKTYTAVEDSYISPVINADTNYGQESILYAQEYGYKSHWAGPDEYWGEEASKTKRAYLKFDLHDIKSTDTISSAVLTFNARTAPEGDLQEKELFIYGWGDTSWTEDNLTWNSFSDWLFLTFNEQESWDHIAPSNTTLKGKICYYHRGSLIKRVALLYECTDDEKYAYTTMRNIMSMVNNVGARTDVMNQLDLSNHVRFIGDSFMYCWGSDVMTPEMFTACLKHFYLVEEESLKILNKETLVNNIATNMTSSTYYMAMKYPEFKRADHWYERTLYHNNRIYSAAVFEDGVSVEQSCSYVQVFANTLNDAIGIMDDTSNAYYGNFCDESGMDMLYKLIKTWVYSMAPGYRAHHLGDAADYGASYRNDILKWYNKFGEMGIDVAELEYAATDGNAGILPEFTSVSFPIAKRTYMRSDWSENATYLAFTAKGDNASHGHNDALNIYMEAYGQKLLIDPGYGSVLTGDIFDYMKHANQHNVITVNGGNISINQGNDGVEKEMELNNLYDMATYSYGYVQNAENTERTVLFLKQPNFFIVSDYVVPADTSMVNTYTQFWHMLPSANISISDDGKNEFRSNFESGANVIVSPVDTDNMSDIRLDDTLYSSASGKFDDNLKGVYERKSKENVKYGTVIYPYESGEERAISTEVINTNISDEGASAFKITVTNIEDNSLDTYYYYHLSDLSQKGDVAIGKYKTDATALLVKEDMSGNAVSFFVYDGSYIEKSNIKDKYLFKSNDGYATIGANIIKGNVVELASASLEETGLDNITVYTGFESSIASFNGEKVSGSKKDGAYIYFGDEPIVVCTETAPETSDKEDDFGDFVGGGGNSSSGSSSGGSSGGGMGSVKPDKPVIDEPEIKDEHKPESEITMVSYDDVKESDWYYEYVTELTEKGILSGNGTGNFAPNIKVTREQFLKMLLIAIDTDIEEAENTFVDVLDHAWYKEYVLKGKSLGIVNGVSDTKFGVGSNITRQDMAVMICRTLENLNIKTEGISTDMFKDYDLISDYAKESVDLMKSIGLIEGYNNEFRPLDNLTRAEASKIIFELLKLTNIQ